MSQILCWDTHFEPSEFKESVVFCDSKDKVMSYLTSTSVILFNKSVLEVKENLYLLILIKVSYPGTLLIFVNGDKYPNFFENIPESQLDKFITSSIIRTFRVEDKSQSIQNALSIIMNSSTN